MICMRVSKKPGKFKEIPMPPKPLSIEVTEAKLEIKKDNEHEDGRLEIHQMNGFVFDGVLVKDLFRTEEWHNILPKLKPLYIAFHGCNRPLQIDVWYNEKWMTIWQHGNDFESFAEEKKSDKAYENFINKEGKKVAKLIDEGKTFSQIRKAMSNEHSGNTYGCAMLYGISKAKNRVNAEKVRIAHNKDCGCKDSKVKGVVNPAILTMSVK